MTQVINPNAAFGQSDLQTTMGSVQFPMLASAAVAAKRVVAVGTNGQVATAATDGTASLVIGVANNAIATGGTGTVIVYGIAEDVPADGTVTAGLLLKRSATTAGSVAATATPAIGEVIGVAINASAGGTVDMWVRPGALS